jgi:hypothetical protein
VTSLVDNLDGSVGIAWAPVQGATSYNVYVNGVLNQSVSVGMRARISGLTRASYAVGSVAAPSGNSLRPQSLPPVGVVTPSATYVIKIVPVLTGTEFGPVQDQIVTVAPTSVMLVTPMSRGPFPFPSTPGGY